MFEKLLSALIILVIMIVICSPMFIKFHCSDCDGEMEEMYDELKDKLIYKCKKCGKMWI